MARLVAVLALFACIAIVFAAEAAKDEKKDDLQTAAGHLFGFGLHKGFYHGYGYGYPFFYPHFYGHHGFYG